jgi:hypothetical protein
MKKNITINIGCLVKYQIAVTSGGTEAAKRELVELLLSAIRDAEQQEDLAAPSQCPESRE